MSSPLLPQARKAPNAAAEKGLRLRNQIRKVFKDAGGHVPVGRISRLLGRSRPTIRHHVRILVEEGHLIQTGEHGQRRYFVTEKGGGFPAVAVTCMPDLLTYERIGPLLAIAEAGNQVGGPYHLGRLMMPRALPRHYGAAAARMIADLLTCNAIKADPDGGGYVLTRRGLAVVDGRVS